MMNFNPSATSPDGSIDYALPNLRNRSRDLIRNNPIAKGVIDTIVTGTLGSGLRLNVNIDNDVLQLNDSDAKKLNQQIEAEFNSWAESQFCDTERTQNFYGLQEMALRQMLENGEALALITRRESYRDINTAINMIEADLLETPQIYQNHKELFNGVRKDNFGAAVSYFFKQPERSAINSSDPYLTPTQNFKEILTYDENNLRQLLHLYNKTRPGQTRGVPILANVMTVLKQIDRYMDAELMASVIASYFTAFISDSSNVSSTPRTPFVSSDEKSVQTGVQMGPGTIAELSGNRKIDIANPSRPNAQFGAFIMSVIQQVAMGVGLPYEIVIRHFASSYSASQGALLEAYKFFKAYRQKFIENFTTPIYERFFIDAINAGRITAPDFFTDNRKRRAYLSCDWIGPSKGMIDELKEVKAAQLRVEMNISTLQLEAAARGLNVDRIFEQRSREIAKMTELGLNLEQVIKNKTEAINVEDD